MIFVYIILVNLPKKYLPYDYLGAVLDSIAFPWCKCTNLFLYKKNLVEDRLVLRTSWWRYEVQAYILPCTPNVVGGARGRTPPTRQKSDTPFIAALPARPALRCAYRKREVFESVSLAKASDGVETNSHRTTRKRKETRGEKKLCGGCRAASTWASGKRATRIPR